MHNIHKYEKIVRVFLGLMMIFLANGDFNIISFAGIVVILTGATGYCPVYKLFRVNENLSIENEFLTYLPKSNPEPVFVFNEKGNMVYQNKASKEILPNIFSFQDISEIPAKEMIETKRSISSKYTYEDKVYAIEALGDKDKKFILAYGFNITEIEKSKAILKYQTITDPLTLLGNRIKIIHDIQTFEKNSNLSILLIDLVKFSQINSFFGHAKGDEFLKIVAKELENFQKNALHVNSIYRLRGNTFALLMVFDKDKNEDIQKAQFKYKEKLFELFSNLKIELDEISTNVEIIIGLAKSTDETSASELLNHAETALSEVKRSSLKYLCYSDIANINERYKNNLHWAGKLHDIFDEHSSAKIVAYFQPIYSYPTAKIEKFESLVRIVDADKVISPFAFLDIAKQINYLPKITKEVFKQALEKFQNTSFEFSLNITTQDLEDEELGNFMLNALSEKSMLPSSVVLEVLEDEDMYEYIDKILELKKLGFKIAVDDFGVGYSNFQKLQQLQLDYIKIDASLIKNIATNEKDRSIVTSICSYAKTIGVKTIGEFVADADIFDVVKSIGVDYAQGYFVGAPDPQLKEEFSRG